MKFGRLLLWTSVEVCACQPVMASSEPTAPVGLDGSVPRRPDGVVVEPLPAIPSAVDRGDARGIVALREPIDLDRVKEVVLAISDAWRHGSLDTLRDLLAPEAVELEGAKGGRAVLLNKWKERLSSFSSDRLPGGPLFALDRMDHYSYEDMAIGRAPPRPPTMRPGDVYVRVPFEVTQVGSDRVFGDVLELLIRREGRRMLVTGYGESAKP